MRGACWISKITRTYTLARMHSPTLAHTHTEYVTRIAFPQQQRLRELATVLRCTYIACLVSYSSV